MMKIMCIMYNVRKEALSHDFYGKIKKRYKNKHVHISIKFYTVSVSEVII